MEKSLPFVAMIMMQFAQVASLIIGKKAIATGMTNFSFVFYTNAFFSLILLPSCFIFHRSNLPPINFKILGGFLLLGILGFLVQIVGFAGIKYAPATLASAMLNLIPGFTFILAIIFKVERAKFGSRSTVAKAIGTIVSIVGAIIITLYKGPGIFMATLDSTIVPQIQLEQPSDWIIGGLLLAIDSVIASFQIVLQALILKKYPAELPTMFAFCSIVAILSAVTSLIMDGDLSKFSLESKTRLFAVLYSGIFGAGLQITVGAWCVHKKGPLFVAMFHPIGIVISAIMGAIFFRDGFYLGSLIGSIVIVVGFYSVMWGKSKEGKVNGTKNAVKSNLNSENVPFLQIHSDESQIVVV